MQPIIVRNELATYRARALCPVCTEPRELRFGGVQLACYPPLYPHECQTCGYTTNLDHQYPRIEYN